MQTYDLAALGWTDALADAFSSFGAKGLVPARVAAQGRGRYILFAPQGELAAEPSGRLRHEAVALPAVGDWVAARLSPGLALIEAVLPARTAFLRADPDHGGRPETVAANLDLVLVVMGADHDFNLRRLERFLAAAWDSGAEPWVVLTKTDLAQTPAALVRQVERACPGAPVLAVSNLTGEGVEQVRRLIRPGRTAALLGSSGVGKSSLVNSLAGEVRQAVARVREDGRGRHTTTRRELILLEGGGLVLDTPGMRQFNPIDDGGLEATFTDVEALARACRFSDCRHAGEPGCAVAAAIEAGELEASRLAGWAKLRRELEHLDRKEDRLAEAAHRRRWKAIHKSAKAHMRAKRTGWT